ncbi:MAG TPA: carbon-nitrogen hydrolase family protein, partial [Armatimonadota bacterium]
MARFVTVSSIAWNIAAGCAPEDGVGEACALLRQAARQQPDLVIFPEVFLHCGWSLADWAQAGEAPNALTEQFSVLARECRTNIILPLPVVDAGRCYNSVLIIDRQGKIRGRYDQAYANPLEIEAGIYQGSGVKTF